MVANAPVYPWPRVAVHCGLRRNALRAPDFPALGGVKDWADWLADREDEDMPQRIRAPEHQERFG